MGVLTGYYKLPVQIPENAPGALTTPQRPALLAFLNQPGGALSQQAAGLAGQGGWKPGPGRPLYGGPAFAPGSDGSQGVKSSLMGQNGIIGGEDNQRFSSFEKGALAGYQYSKSPWGALIGGLIGYGAAGGVKDANPIDASGFSGTGMQQAWKDQNLARLGSNPGAAVASKLASAVGVDENSFHGKALQAGLDPAAFLGGLFGGGGSHKRNWNAFNQAFPGTTVNEQGNYVLPSQFNNAVITQKQLDDLAGTWYGATYHPDGDQSGWEQKYNDVLTSIFGG